MVGTKAVRSWPHSWSRSSSMDEMIFMVLMLSMRCRSRLQLRQSHVDRRENLSLGNVDQRFLAQLEQSDEINHYDRHTARRVEQIGKLDETYRLQAAQNAGHVLTYRQLFAADVMVGGQSGAPYDVNPRCAEVIELDFRPARD